MTKSDKERSEISRRRQRGRNWALCAALGAMAVLFYALTFITMGNNG